MKSYFLSAIVLVLTFHSAVFAQNKPRVGRAAAAKYFQAAKGGSSAEDVMPERSPASSGDHYMMLGLGKAMSSSAWDWGGDGKENNVGGFGLGVTYRVGEWVSSMDLHIRIEYTEFDPRDQKASKLSFLPMITFPDATSRFPLYFGGGLGAGVFLRQADKESPLSFDYQLVVGARFFDVFENTGFFLETGLKNHLLLTSSGQYNSTFFSAGAVITF